ncbi:MAG TPA: SwmB domain-containing protein [Abditibacteriaceae bacterium]|nr:SwmB domain-containing protein [Abditibacteriaceae bacterium]
MLFVAAPARVAVAITVRNTNDNGIGSLRAAINYANATAAADRIVFAIPGSGLQTITLNTGLPAITAPVTINGYTQPGASPNTRAIGTNAVLLIKLKFFNSTGGPLPNGLSIAASNCVVKGLIFNGFARGISIDGATANNNVIRGCFIGTDSTGRVASANETGVAILRGRDNIIGGATRNARNLISGNGFGIQIAGAASTSNLVDNNIIGAKSDGLTRLGNTRYGVAITSGAQDNAVGERFGVGNTISFNGEGGVLVADASTGNSIRGNSISRNTGLGINLAVPADPANGVTPNDNLDSDSGPNNLQNRPLITAATVSLGTNPVTRITVAFNTIPSEPFALDFYAAPGFDPSGAGEGKRYLTNSTRIVNSKFNGDVDFELVLAGSLEGQYVTATATHIIDADTEETSEFSNSRKVVLAGTESLTRRATTGLSAGYANAAASTVQLSFTNALDAAAATEPMHYTVEVNGVQVAILSAAWDAGTNRVTLGLAPGVLRAGDHVVVSWHGLTDAAGSTLSDGNEPLTAR